MDQPGPGAPTGGPGGVGPGGVGPARARGDGGEPGVRPPRRAAAEGARRRRRAASGNPPSSPRRRPARRTVGVAPRRRPAARLGLLLVGVDLPADRPAVDGAIAVDHPAGKCHRDLERHELEERLLVLRILLRNLSAVFLGVERQCEAVQVAVPDQFHALRVETGQRRLAVTDLGAVRVCRPRNRSPRPRAGRGCSAATPRRRPGCSCSGRSARTSGPSAAAARRQCRRR